MVDRDRNIPEDEKLKAARGIIAEDAPKKKRGRPRKEEDVIVDPEEDAVWITYDTDDPDMVLLQPLMRIGQVMVNPAKAGSFHVRGGAAKKIVEALGIQYAVENGVIVRRLGYEFTFDYAPDSTGPGIAKALRADLLKLGVKATNGVKGIHVVAEGKLPAAKIKDWIYITIPKTSTCAAKAGMFNRAQLTPEGNVGAARGLKRGIFDDSGILEFATYGEQVINLRMIAGGEGGIAKLIYTAIKNGAQFALKYIAKEQTLEEFLKLEVKAIQDSRAGDIKKTEETLAAEQAKIAASVEALRAAQVKAEDSQHELKILQKKTSTEALLKEFPGLLSVAGINDDDPSTTVIITKDIILNGINLGPYRIKVNPTMAEVNIGAKKVPKEIIHPTLYLQDGKWKWDIDKAVSDEILKAASMNRMAKMAHLIIGTLMAFNEKDAGQVERLKKIEDYMKEDHK